MTTSSKTFDVVILGGGPAGYGAALYGASAGLSVALVEASKVGGTCLHKGCVPAKEFLETAAIYRSVSNAKTFGIETSKPKIDFSISQARKQKVVDQLWKGLTGLLRKRKVTIIQGRGYLKNSNTVEVEGYGQLEGNYIILATGSDVRTLDGFEVDGRFVMTSDEVLSLETLPSSVAVIGGGAIGCEFASMMSDLGVKVTILEALPQLLTGVDADVAQVLDRSFKKRGIEVKTGVRIQGHIPGASTTKISFSSNETDGEKLHTLEVDTIIVSVGRKPNSEKIASDQIGLEIDDRGFVVVDNKMRTNLENVYAIGDLVPTAQLAHVGFAEAIVAIKEILKEDPLPVNYSAVPWCIYSHPEVAFVGLSEDQARNLGHDILVSKHRFAGNSRALIIGESEGLVKVISERNYDGSAGKILGVHLVGPWATELLGQGYLAVNWEATPEEVSNFIQPHPTLSEAFGETVMSLTGRGLHG